MVFADSNPTPGKHTGAHVCRSFILHTPGSPLHMLSLVIREDSSDHMLRNIHVLRVRRICECRRCYLWRVVQSHGSRRKKEQAKCVWECRFLHRRLCDWQAHGGGGGMGRPEVGASLQHWWQCLGLYHSICLTAFWIMVSSQFPPTLWTFYAESNLPSHIYDVMAVYVIKVSQ